MFAEMSRTICIDYGLRRTGIAISDESEKIALPLMTIEGDERILLEKLKTLLDEYEVSRIVIGLPLNLSGHESELCIKVRAFAEKIRMLCENIVFMDERLTSIEAQRAMTEMELKPSRHKSKIDIIAATLILQSYLDSLRSYETNDETTN